MFARFIKLVAAAGLVYTGFKLKDKAVDKVAEMQFEAELDRRSVELQDIFEKRGEYRTMNAEARKAIFTQKLDEFLRFAKKRGRR